MKEWTIGQSVRLKGDDKCPQMLINQEVWVTEGVKLYQCIWHDNGVIRSIAIAPSCLEECE